MKKQFVEAAKKGTIVKSNTFDTPHGSYAIDILVHDGVFYFYKSKNGKIVECINLKEEAAKHECVEI